jgi:hypothetical protein
MDRNSERKRDSETAEIWLEIRKFVAKAFVAENAFGPAFDGVVREKGRPRSTPG